MSNSRFDQLANNSISRNYSDAELRAMPKQYRLYIAKENGDAIEQPAGWAEFSKGRKGTSADQMAAIKISMEVQVKPTSHFRPEAYVNVTGGRMHYTPQIVTQQNLNGTVNSRANAAIPTGFKQQENHPNVQQVAALAAQVCKVKDGAWTVNVPINSWNKVLAQSETVTAVGLAKIATDIKSLLSTSKTWLAMDAVSRNAITGLEALTFIRDELDVLPDDEYQLLNARIVQYLYEPWVEEKGEYFERLDIQDKPVVSATCFEIFKPQPKVQQVLAAEKIVPAMYLGGHSPALVLPASQGVFKSTLETYQKMMDVQVGNNSSTAILSGMRGYSGLTDDFGKKIQFILSSLMFTCTQGHLADVQLDTTGDIAILRSSISHWVSYLTKKEQVKEAVLLNDTKFILPKAKDMMKVHTKLKEHILYEPRTGSVIISYDPGTVPTPHEKKAIVDYDSEARAIIPTIWDKNPVIAYVAIFSSIFFNTETGLNSSRIKSSRYHVFNHGTAAMFCGVVTTFENFSLIGYGYKQVEGKWDTRGEEGIVEVPLKKVDSFKQWLIMVAKDAAVQMVAFLRPLSRYSPISNLPFMSKAGLNVVLTSVSSEDGYLLENVRNVASATIRRGKKLELDAALPPPATIVATEQQPAPPDQPKPNQRKRRKIIIGEDADIVDPGEEVIVMLPSEDDEKV